MRDKFSCKERVILVIVCVLYASLLSGCSPNMSRQPRYSPYSRSNFFPDQRSERPLVEGTIAINRASAGQSMEIMKNTGAAGIPVPVTMDLLKRGQDRFDIYCSPCHSRIGNGRGMVVQRGFVAPPSFHMDRLRQEPDSHYFAVMTEGFGKMWSYATRVNVPDRWAIVSYIRALQLSQSAPAGEVSQDELKRLETNQ